MVHPLDDLNLAGDTGRVQAFGVIEVLGMEQIQVPDADPGRGQSREILPPPLDAVVVEQNSFGSGFLAAAPFEGSCFPYAQHFLTTSYPQASQIQDQKSLEDAVRSFAVAED